MYIKNIENPNFRSIYFYKVVFIFIKMCLNKMKESLLYNALLENLNNEEKRNLTNKQQRIFKGAMDKLAKDVYGSEYGKRDEKNSENFGVDVNNDLSIQSLFSIGNAKLSPDTLIINFTSALGCPSINDCPITQKACYAVAGENRLKNTRRKNILVQKLVQKAYANKKLDSLFTLAELYIETLKDTKKPIKFIRFNEAGDFPNQQILEMSGKFAKEMKDKYGILSMAYTAKKNLDPSVPIDGVPIDEIMAINRSRMDIKKSENAIDRNFFGIPMKSFSENPNVNLENAYTNVTYISDEQANSLKVEKPINGKYGIPSVPVLNKGSWDGGSGYYYVCPCSFWRYNKNKATTEYFRNVGILGQNEEYPEDNGSKISKLWSQLSEEQKKELKSILSKIKSPCGTYCAVCHDVEGGVTKDGQECIKKYTILTATHGSTASNYDPHYAEEKRKGNDNVIYKGDDSNPNGHWRVPQNAKLINKQNGVRSDFIQTKESVELDKLKQQFFEEYNKINATVI